MQLTFSQHDAIDRFLEQHQLDFLDFMLEVKDHLATATEELMKEKEIPFEEAFPLAAKAWETELLVKKYWLISNERLFPNFVIQRIKSIHAKNRISNIKNHQFQLPFQKKEKLSFNFNVSPSK